MAQQRVGGHRHMVEPDLEPNGAVRQRNSAAVRDALVLHFGALQLELELFVFLVVLDEFLNFLKKLLGTINNAKDNFSDTFFFANDKILKMMIFSRSFSDLSYQIRRHIFESKMDTHFNIRNAKKKLRKSHLSPDIIL